MSRSAAICLLLIAFAGCRSSAPDPNFQQANAIYQQLYATQLDDAYGDPKMDEVVALLHKVSARSVDASRAQAMLGARSWRSNSPSGRRWPPRRRRASPPRR